MQDNYTTSVDQHNNSTAFVSDWYVVPSRIRRLPGITLAFLDIYETVFQFLNKGKTCFLTNKTISDRTGHKIRCIQNALAFFEKHQELKRVQHGSKYYIVQPERKIETEARPMEKEGCTAVHPPHAQPCTHK